MTHRTETHRSETYGDVVYRFLGIVDFPRVAKTMTLDEMEKVLESHPRRFFGASRIVGLGDGQWDPFEVWTPVVTDNRPGLPIAVSEVLVAKWQKLWSKVLRSDRH